MNVEMGEIKVCYEGCGHDALVTEGITTCIAIMLQGSYHDTRFILMDHWDGEVIGEKEYFMQYKTGNYLAHIQDAVIDDYDPDLHEDIPVFIDKVVIVGGEKKQWDEDGDLLVSGTESSVNLLKQSLITSLAQIGHFTHSASQTWCNYVTSDTQSIGVAITLDGVANYVFEDQALDNDGVDTNPQGAPKPF